MNIALLYNARPEGLDRTDPRLERYIEGDEWKTIEAVGIAIERNGHKISYLKVDKDIYERLRANKHKLDLVFNLSEGVSGGSDREAQIPMICEILGIPHTGPTPLSAALILHKSRAKEIWRSYGVTTAKSQLFTSPSQKLQKSLQFPLIVKPTSEGSGIGIKSNSIVTNARELKSATSKIIKEYHQAALVETYLSGREFTSPSLATALRKRSSTRTELFEFWPETER